VLKEDLQGTGVDESVVRDLKSLTEEFDEIVLPFVKKHSSIFKFVSLVCRLLYTSN